MTLTLYRWRNTEDKSEFDESTFYLRNGIVVKFMRFGLEFSFNKLHVTLSLFSPYVMYEASLIFKKKPSIFRDNILFEKTW